jgi:hypothetical protein
MDDHASETLETRHPLNNSLIKVKIINKIPQQMSRRHLHKTLEVIRMIDVVLLLVLRLTKWQTTSGHF